MTTVVAELRRATAAAHARVESHFSSLLTPAPSVDEYRDFLRAMYAFHGALEPALEAVLPQKRARVAALLDDLSALDLAVPRSLCEVPPLDSLGRALGAAYVVDGSSLGARVLHRHLSQRWPRSSFAFLERSGEAAVPAFRELVDTLDRFEGERASVVESALATFDALDRHLACAQR
jgi:heme oxygenase